MRKFLLIPILFLAVPLAAQTIFLSTNQNNSTQTSSTPFHVYQGTYLPVTAVVNGVNNKGGTWTSSGGTLTNATCTANGPCTVAIYSATTTSPVSLTFTSAANPSVSKTTWVQFDASPTPVTNPAFLITSSNLASLQAKANGSNLLFQSQLSLATSNWNAMVTAGWNFTCPGGGYTTLPQFADFGALYYFALMGYMGDTSKNWNCATQLIIEKEFPLATANSINFAGNTWSDFSSFGVLGIGWAVQSGAISSPADLKIVHDFCAWVGLTVNAYDYGAILQPTGFNTSAQFQTGQQFELTSERGMGNNYIMSKILWMVGISMMFHDDTSNDPLIATGTVLGAGNSGALTNIYTGTGYTVGDTFHIGGGGAIGTVMAVSSGAPTVISVTTASTGYNNVSNPMSTTAITGSGTGLTVNITAGNTCGAARGQICSDYTGGSLHSYWNMTTGAYLLREWGHLVNPTIGYATLNAFYPSGGFGSQINCAWQPPPPDGPSYNCFGDGIDGESAEGSWYAYSFFRLRLALNIIHTNGYDDPLLYGPQVELGNADFWDMKMWADRLFMTGTYTQSTLTGPLYGYLITGDANAIARSPGDFIFESEGLTRDQAYPAGTGRTDTSNANLWFTMDSSFGGIDGSQGGCSSHCGYNNEIGNDYASATVFDMLLTQSVNDPETLAPTDPGANYPLDWWNDSYNKHQETRSGYANTDTIFSVYGSNTLINHEGQFQGRFDVYYNGGMITKGSTVFTNYIQSIYSTGRQNMVQIYDSVGSGLTDAQLGTCLAGATGPYGGQLYQDYQIGLGAEPTHSELANYTSYGIDATAGQKGCFLSGAFQFTDTTQAYRDILYLKGLNQVLWYDRDTTGHTASTKVLFLDTSGNGTASSNTVAWTAINGGGNKAKFTSLLPSGATVTANKLLQTLTISGPFSSLQNGTTMQGVCTATYMDGTTANISSTAAWFSDNTSVATVSSTGLVTAVTTGTADIYCGRGPVGNLPTRFTSSATPGYFSGGTMTVVSGSSSGSLVQCGGCVGANQVNDWENLGNVQVTPSGTPLSVNFLSGLAWTNSGGTPATGTLVQSTAGQGYDCGLYGTTLGCFMQTLGAFTGTTYPASGATTHYVSNLAPNTTYTLTGAGTPGTATSDDAGVLTFAAAGTGNIVITPSSGVAAPTSLQGVIIKGATIQ